MAASRVVELFAQLEKIRRSAHALLHVDSPAPIGKIISLEQSKESFEAALPKQLDILHSVLTNMVDRMAAFTQPGVLAAPPGPRQRPAQCRALCPVPQRRIGNGKSLDSQGRCRRIPSVITVPLAHIAGTGAAGLAALAPPAVGKVTPYHRAWTPWSRRRRADGGVRWTRHRSQSPQTGRSSRANRPLGGRLPVIQAGKTQMPVVHIYTRRISVIGRYQTAANADGLRWPTPDRKTSPLLNGLSEKWQRRDRL
jgi:hypothetical protein